MPGGATAGTNLFSTFDVGFFPNATSTTHEDLIDVQVILGSTQCPAFAQFRKDRARSVAHSWTVDALSSTSTGGQFEGALFAGAARPVPARLVNFCQIFDSHVEVSDREREDNPAGQFRDQYEKQTMMAFKEITRNCESRIWTNLSVGSASASAEATVPLMAGILGFGITTSAASASGVQIVDIIRLSQTMYQNGVEPDSVWFAPAHKREFFFAVTAAGSGINVRNIAATDNRFQANVEVMESPFGQLYALIVDRFIPASTATGVSATAGGGSAAYYIGDRSMASLVFFRPPQHKPMGKDGDSTRGIVLMDVTLRLDHPSAWACVSNVSCV